jgi:two-component system CitB family sensor kinase
VPPAELDAFPTGSAKDEAVLIIDTHGVVRYASTGAAALLHLRHPLVGFTVSSIDVQGRLGELLRGVGAGHGTVLLRGRYLEIRRLPVRGSAGVEAVVLLRDRTELVELFAELADVHAVVVGLRTEQHETANRLHVLLGLMQAGEQQAALAYLKELLGMALAEAGEPGRTTRPGTIAALLRTKSAIASSRGVRLTSSALDVLDELALDADTLASVVGNLIDNAIDAAAGSAAATVDVRAERDADGVRLTVRDSGGGVPDDVDVFLDGYTTKSPRVATPRGFGLALVRHLVARSAGTIAVHNDGGAVFTVHWPDRHRRASS